MIRPVLMRASIALALTLVLGCNSTPPPAPVPKPTQPTTPPRPTVAPPAFKVFHQTKDTLTLVTRETATDDEIEAILWQLRDAAHSHTFDKLHIDQKFVDTGKPPIWFHIYRGAKCASEKYASGNPPCGGSYHSAGDYTLDSSRNWEKGILRHADDTETPLWDSEAPYTALKL